jgi:hypothetical protein
MSIHGQCFALPLLLSLMFHTALVAMRVHALYGGLPWIRWTSWIAGTLFVITCIVIMTMGQISATRESFSEGCSYIQQHDLGWWTTNSEINIVEAPMCRNRELPQKCLSLFLKSILEQMPPYAWTIWLPRYVPHKSNSLLSQFDLLLFVLC